MVVGCTAAPVAENPLVGRWFGETAAPGGDGVQRWLMERRADGTFTVTFRRYRDAVPYHTQQGSGRWAYSNGLYSTWTQYIDETATDPKDVHFQRIYVVESLRNAEMIYRHIESGRDFRVTRVPEDFRLP